MSVTHSNECNISSRVASGRVDLKLSIPKGFTSPENKFIDFLDEINPTSTQLLNVFCAEAISDSKQSSLNFLNLYKNKSPPPTR